MPAPGQAPRNRFPSLCGQGSFRGTLGLRLKVEFKSPKFFGRFTISGVTRDSTGAALAACVLHLFESATDTEIAQTESDASGNYTFSIGQNSGFFYIVAYKVGAPDVAGTTVNTLVAV